MSAPHLAPHGARLTVRFGDLRVAVTLPRELDASFASDWLDPPGLAADLELDLRLGPLAGRSLDAYDRFDATAFAFENVRCAVSASLLSRRGELLLGEAPEPGKTYAILNGIVAAAHALILQRGGVLVHAATLLIGGRAFVVLGHSGAGKSTLANRFADTFLHDDYAFLLPEAQGRWTFLRHAETRGPRDDRPWRVPVAGLYVLGPDRSRTSLSAIDARDAFATVLGHAFHAGGAAASSALDGLARLVLDLPPQQLSHCLADPVDRIADLLEGSA